MIFTVLRVCKAGKLELGFESLGFENSAIWLRVENFGVSSYLPRELDLKEIDMATKN